MRIWGIHKRYPSLSWWKNFMGGSITLGNVTIFGSNAMNWVVQIKTKKWGFICFTLPVKARWRTSRDGRRYYHWYFYCSPNGTPCAATYYIGADKQETIRAKVRKLNFGHNFDSDTEHKKLRALNDKFSSFHINEFDLEEYGHYKQ